MSNKFAGKIAVITGASIGMGLATAKRSIQEGMDPLFITVLTKSGILKDDLDYHLLRASMVIIFLFFGYQKWFDYEAQTLVPFMSNGPLISWMYPVFGIGGRAGFWEYRNGCLARSCS